MATLYKTVYSKIYLIPPLGSLAKWIHWGGTGGDHFPYRDILPTWVSGGGPGDPNPIAIIEWKGIGITSGGTSVVWIKVRSRSQGTIGIRFILVKAFN